VPFGGGPVFGIALNILVRKHSRPAAASMRISKRRKKPVDLQLVPARMRLSSGWLTAPFVNDFRPEVERPKVAGPCLSR
jgi:hypothetical protein